MKVLVTGANGFVGNALVMQLLAEKYEVMGMVRSSGSNLPDSVGRFLIPSILDEIDWKTMLEGVNAIIHSAARVHIMDDSAADPLIEFRKVNVDWTLNLARQAVETGVKRFIFISSIKVNGEMTQTGQPFKANDNYIPTDPYGLSKYEAEQGLLAIAEETGLEVVIIRPPLVYGPNVKANFASMMKWINKGVPLPFGAIDNQRSLVALDNLVSFIIQCIDHPKAANEVFLISDGEDISTTTLLQKVARAFGKTPRLIPVPVWLMMFAATLIGKNDVANRLFSSLQLDSSKARDLLGWQPVVTLDEQLAKMVEVSGKVNVLSD